MLSSWCPWYDNSIKNADDDWWIFRTRLFPNPFSSNKACFWKSKCRIPILSGCLETAYCPICRNSALQAWMTLGYWPIIRMNGEPYIGWASSCPQWGILICVFRMTDDLGRSWLREMITDSRKQFLVFLVRDAMDIWYYRGPTPDICWVHLRSQLARRRWLSAFKLPKHITRL